MKYNPITKEIYRDEGAFLKKLHCTVAKQWEELSATNSLKGKLCDHCQTTILYTALLNNIKSKKFTTD
ncbi:hypothetical protein [Mucilaginibacter sp.]|uniref:hypothetical protein n=1 Tax=Mucilaginibacter sp. TaxID=1882438 RepID=UPI0035BC2D5C